MTDLLDMLEAEYGIANDAGDSVRIAVEPDGRSASSSGAGPAESVTTAAEDVPTWLMAGDTPQGDVLAVPMTVLTTEPIASPPDGGETVPDTEQLWLQEQALKKEQGASVERAVAKLHAQRMAAFGAAGPSSFGTLGVDVKGVWGLLTTVGTDLVIGTDFQFIVRNPTTLAPAGESIFLGNPGTTPPAVRTPLFINAVTTATGGMTVDTLIVQGDLEAATIAANAGTGSSPILTQIGNTAHPVGLLLATLVGSAAAPVTTLLATSIGTNALPVTQIVATNVGSTAVPVGTLLANIIGTNANQVTLLVATSIGTTVAPVSTLLVNNIGTNANPANLLVITNIGTAALPVSTLLATIVGTTANPVANLVATNVGNTVSPVATLLATTVGTTANPVANLVATNIGNTTTPVTTLLATNVGTNANPVTNVVATNVGNSTVPVTAVTATNIIGINGSYTTSLQVRNGGTQAYTVQNPIFGEYSCVATGAIGSATTNVAFTVTATAAPPLTPLALTGNLVTGISPGFYEVYWEVCTSTAGNAGLYIASGTASDTQSNNIVVRSIYGTGATSTVIISNKTIITVTATASFGIRSPSGTITLATSGTGSTTTATMIVRRLDIY